MRVQPHLPSRPLVATVMSSAGLAWCACSAANSPAPPEPRIRMSVSSRSSMRTLPGGGLYRHVEIDACQIDPKLDCFEMNDVAGLREDLELETLLTAAVVLDPHLILIDEGDMADGRERFVEVELWSTIDIDRRWRKHLDHHQRVGDVGLRADRPAADHHIGSRFVPIARIVGALHTNATLVGPVA